ncbi:PA2169 family four-helix-bundle protein [Pedobacter sp. HMF7647]|uniref:PA2169 family four-helix-bundle protein n=1 Tax=Hufsiella arboris TaxID=2695275 RepID=A0A7K1Y8G3_9SPHI|nr:PA2169 family four-helix-bundle protein [Hufsiella arboris]MXV50661.1 PA2169 family four-helix-bundle protein [Hufsiella arboris]
MEHYIKQLQHLYSIAEDGKQGYLRAAEKTESNELKELFKQFSNEREAIANDIAVKISRYGGSVQSDENGGPLGIIHRNWLNIKTAFTSNNDQVILETCKNGDLAALDAYDDALQGDLLYTSLKKFLTEHRLIIREAFDKIDQLYFKTFKET